jgi:hypothetical protein
MNISNNNKEIISEELVLSISGEGGGWDIYRITFNDSTVIFYEKTNCAFSADDLDMTEEEFQAYRNKVKYYNSFEEYWQNYTSNGIQGLLHYSNIHPDYKVTVTKTVRKARLEYIEKYGLRYWRDEIKIY